MAMDFTRAKERVRGLLAGKPGELSKSALTSDPLRDRIIGEQSARVPRFQATLNDKPIVEYERDGEQQSFEWEGFAEAVRDFARGAFSFQEPELRGREEMEPNHRFNHAIVEAALEDPAMGEVRPYARNNPAEAIYGAMAFADKLVELAQEHAAEHVAREQQISEQMANGKNADDLMENLRKLAKQEVADQGDVQPGTRKQIKQAYKQQQQTIEKIVELMQQASPARVKADAVAMAHAAAEAAAEAAQLLSNLPGTEEGESQQMDPEAQIALAEKWNETDMLRKVARQLGRRIRSLAFKRETRTKNVAMYPVGIETGDVFERLLPSELARAAAPNPVVQAQFLRDLEDRSLLQYEKHGKLPAGKGPIIAAHDGSGSMREDMGGLSKLGWSKSLGIALQTIARREKRDYAAVEFGARTELRTWEFPKHEKVDPDALVDYAAHFFGGGTDTAIALREAVRIVREVPAFKTADVILIGDGQDRYADEDKALVKELRDMGVRLHGISIGCPNNAYMAEACDHVIEIADLAQEEAVLDALAENIT
jgi:uncharacterized protein with von Willebrand factor type A (vWA) domain